MPILESQYLRVDIRPDLGGRIDQIRDSRTGKDWLWHPRDYDGAARSLPLGASFDEHWSGGFDEIFPSDAACHFEGRDLPVHGELWSQPWELAQASERELTLVRRCLSVPVIARKKIAIDETSRLRITYSLENLDQKPISFLFKLHPALAIEAGDEIMLPRCRVKPVDQNFSGLLQGDDWRCFQETPLSQVLGSEARTQEFVYCKDLEDGWFGLKNSRTGSKLTMRFDRGRLPYFWLFQIYGGWRDHHVLVAEPSTNMPWDLNDALRCGSCGRLESLGTFSTEVAMSVD